ncbi:MAG TPA: DoxX family protein [Alloacidobacterium sp.]|nr:DoxX family protein [Alloacidobacterium sp.]
MKPIVATTNDITLAICRLVLGIIFFIHGAQLALGWFGGFGFSGSMHFMTVQLHIPALFAVIAILAQFLGGIGLIVGLLSRIAAFGIACVMLVAVIKIHLAVGFFMNWYGAQKGEGYEYHLLVLAICLLIFVKGSGALSIDQILSK